MQYVHTPDGWKPKAEVEKPLKVLPISATSSKGAAKTKGQAATKASVMPSVKASGPAEGGDTSSLLPLILELQRQVVANGEDIRAVQ
ncbi:hypothetical protein [Acinetobacter indicus]|uniref:hypothetical protein n=1 Tax=Acinetobacter indicus TaxID=756892 RepID=UPI001C089CE4|nr:hypothetical protein [Acinetobacter indicus]